MPTLLFISFILLSFSPSQSMYLAKVSKNLFKNWTTLWNAVLMVQSIRLGFCLEWSIQTANNIR